MNVTICDYYPRSEINAPSIMNGPRKSMQYRPELNVTEYDYLKRKLAQDFQKLEFYTQQRGPQKSIRECPVMPRKLVRSHIIKPVVTEMNKCKKKLNFEQCKVVPINSEDGKAAFKVNSDKITSRVSMCLKSNPMALLQTKKKLQF